MKYYTSLKNVVFFMLLFLNVEANAQCYKPVVGDKVMFLPVSEHVKKQVDGFDCFYSYDKTYKKNIYQFKPKDRYKKNKTLLTPYSEIEGHIFNVTNVSSSSYVSKLLCVLLEREDGEKVFYVITESSSSELNVLTTCLLSKKYGDILMPCVKCSDLYFYKNMYGKDFVSYGIYKDDFLGHSKFGNVLTIDSLFFKETNSPYKQPYVRISKTNYYPIEDVPLEIINSKNSYYSIHFFKDSFIEKKEYIKQILDGYTGRNCFPSIGKYNYGVKEKKLNYSPLLYDKYGVKKGEYNLCFGEYDFESYGVRPNYDRNKTVEFVFRDSLNNTFAIPVYELFETEKNLDIKGFESYGSYVKMQKEKYENSKRLHFFKYFTSIDSVDFVRNKIAEEKLLAIKNKQEAQRIKEKEYNDYVKAYGVKYAKYIQSLSDGAKEKFLRCAKKWGASTAQDIVNGYVKIGWSKEKCKESWGEPDDINKSIGSWGVHEQWCYSRSYLYFENGKLTSIQN